MAQNCTNPFAGGPNTFHFIFNILLIPILIGVGILGNFFNIVVLSRADMRKRNSIYTYLTALAVADILTVILALPLALRDAGVLAPTTRFSYEMAYFVVIHYCVANIMKHSGTWVIVTVALVRYIAISRPLKSERWTNLSTSRILVFIIFLLITVIDMPRFFELKVETIKNHCFNMTMWDWELTDFARQELYYRIYPWMSIAICFIIPFCLIVISNVQLIKQIKISRAFRRKMANYSYMCEDKRDLQTNIMLVTIIVVFFCLEFPDAIVHIIIALGANANTRHHPGLNRFITIANFLSLLNSSINFILYSALSNDFRRVFRRTFCKCSEKIKLARRPRTKSTSTMYTTDTSAHSPTRKTSHESVTTVVSGLEGDRISQSTTNVWV